MKKIFLFIASLIAIGGIGQGNQRLSPHDTVSNAHVTVTYGRPYKKDRVVFGELEKFGKVWRLGADEATTIAFRADVKFGGQAVHAGTYTLFALLNENEWTLILNSKLGQWGAFSYDQNKDVAQTTVPVKKLDKVVEQLTIHFNGEDEMVIEWDQTQVSIPLKFE